MSATETEDKTAEARKQALAQFESIQEMVKWLDADKRKERVEEIKEELLSAYHSYEATTMLGEPTLDYDDWFSSETVKTETKIDKLGAEILELEDFDEDEARERIQEDALSVEVRSGWHAPGEEGSPSEFTILLCTGGPAVRIIGELDDNFEPHRAWLECQDWFTPWTQVYIEDGQDALLTYARQFYFGE